MWLYVHVVVHRGDTHFVGTSLVVVGYNNVHL